MAASRNPVRQVLYFLCGAVLGLLLGLMLVVRPALAFGWPTGITTAAIGACALLCGLLSVRFGDRFWRSFGGSS